MTKVLNTISGTASFQECLILMFIDIYEIQTLSFKIDI